MQEVFDNRSDLELQPGYRSMRRAQAGRAGARRLAIVAGVFGAGLVSAGLVWEYSNHRARAVPVIEADARPLRVKPENPGGMQIAGAGESILSGPEVAPQSLAPPPEAPDPGSLHMQEQSSRARDAAAQAAAIPGLTAQEMSAPPAAAPSAAAQTAMSLQPPAPTLALPAQTPPVQMAAAAPRLAPLAAAPNAAPANGRQVQLAAVGSEAAANAEWSRLARLMPDLLGRHHPEISHFERDGHVFWRLRTGGFADSAAVTNFCAQVRAKGAACTAAGF